MKLLPFSYLRRSSVTPVLSNNIAILSRFGQNLRVLAAFLVAAFAVGFASAAEPLVVKMTASKVQSAPEGEVTLVSAETALPGDILHYEVSCSNTGEVGLGGVAPMIPIPPGMIYIADSATPVASGWSEDGKIFQAFPLSDEKETDQSAIRSVRWAPENLEAGEVRTVSLRVRLLDNASPTPTQN